MPSPFLIIMKKEFRDSLKSRWLLSFAVTFFFLALGVPYIILRGGGVLPEDYPGMVVSTLVSLSVPLVPLIALAMSSTSVSGERETGTLEFLLAQPASKMEVFLGKYVGILVSITLAMILGYGTAELLVYSSNPVFALQFLYGLVYSMMLSGAAISLGFLVSVLSKGRVNAQGAGIFIWFLMVVIYDVGFLGVIAVVLDLSEYLVPMTLANPVELTRTISLMHMARSPLGGELGPVATYMSRTWGPDLTVTILSTTLGLWILIPLGISAIIFRKQDAR
ncbi:MAG: ABC transporter permease [Thaumarchaeota archaeon]|nr:ABC transporter permease [Nitrososphaerota archaeon]